MSPIDLESKQYHVLVLTPTGRDADVVRQTLAEANIHCELLNQPTLRNDVAESAGCLLLAEEALRGPILPDMMSALAAQPAWSDLPVIVLTADGDREQTAFSEKLAQRLPSSATFLQRPLRKLSLLSAVRTALRSRQRQYEVRDILIHHQRTEQALRDSEAKFRSVFENAAIGIGRVRFDDARWINVNDTFCKMLGYCREEMLATPWPQITHPDDIDLDLVPFKRMAAGELEQYSVEKRFIHKDGHHVWARLSLSLVRDEQGRPDYEIAVIENITRRKLAQNELEAERALLQAVLDSLPVAVWIADAKGTVTRANRAVESVWGQPALPYDIEGYRAYQGWWADSGRLIEPEEWALARAVLNGEVSTGEIIDIERFDGRRGTILNNGAPFATPKARSSAAWRWRRTLPS